MDMRTAEQKARANAMERDDRAYALAEEIGLGLYQSNPVVFQMISMIRAGRSERESLLAAIRALATSNAEMVERIGKLLLMQPVVIQLPPGTIMLPSGSKT
ncbi:MAG: hypothetical protein WC700_08945 [Gemmatimonadaceae bacterium]|jgi:hypothetical protein